jgi:hypothetical protein
MKDWKKIYSNNNLATAMMVTDLLIQNEVPAKLLDRQDSSYVFLGEVEVYVPNDFVNIAHVVLKTIEQNTLEA